jgi:putative glutamine transport system substrate-binding protein
MIWAFAVLRMHPKRKGAIKRQFLPGGTMLKKLHYQIIWIFSLLIFLLSGFKFVDPTYARLSFDLISKMQQLCAQDKIKVGVREDLRPFGYKEQENWRGFDIDLAKEFGRRWCGDENKIEFVSVTVDDRIPLLNGGEVDILIAGMTHTWGREEIDFSNPYFLDGQGLLVPITSTVKNITQLNGKSVVVIEGTTADTITCKQPELKLNCKKVESEEIQLAFDFLEKRQVDAFIRDSVNLSQENYNDETLKLVTDDTGQPYTFTQEPYAIGVRQGESELRELINATLQAMKADGMFDTLYIKSFGSRKPYPILQIPGLDPTLTRNYSKIELIQARGKWLVVGVKTDTSGFGYLNDQGRLEGFDIDLVKALAQEWGITEDKIIFVPVTSANRIEKLLNNEIDFIAATMTHTWGRAELIAFSNTYFLDGASLLIRKEDAADIKGIENLQG